MSRQIAPKLIITETTQANTYQLIELFRRIDVSRLGSPDHRRRNPTQDAYVDSLINKPNAFQKVWSAKHHDLGTSRYLQDRPYLHY